VKVYIETYGCQMNEYDSEIIRAILDEADLENTDTPETADVVLINTCAVREHAAMRVINRIYEIRHLPNGARLRLGVVGCMATGLKKQLGGNHRLPVDFFAGPDSYRLLPGLLSAPAPERPPASGSAPPVPGCGSTPPMQLYVRPCRASCRWNGRVRNVVCREGAPHTPFHSLNITIPEMLPE